MVRGVPPGREAEQQVGARYALGRLARLALRAAARRDGLKPLLLVSQPCRRLFRPGVDPTGGELRATKIPHGFQQLNERLTREVALARKAIERNLVGIVGQVSARSTLDLGEVPYVGLVARIVGRVPRRRQRVDGPDAPSGELRGRLPRTQKCDLPRRRPLRVRVGERVADAVHQLVETVPALAAPRAADDDDLPEQLVEEIAAAHDGGRRERPRDGAAVEGSGRFVVERRHEVIALAGIAELPAERGVGSVGPGLRPVEERVLDGRRAARGGAVGAPPETDGRSDRADVDEIAKDVRRRSPVAVTFDQRAVSEGFDDVVALAVEGARRRGARDRDARRHDHAEQSPPRYRAHLGAEGKGEGNGETAATPAQGRMACACGLPSAPCCGIAPVRSNTRAGFPGLRALPPTFPPADALVEASSGRHGCARRIFTGCESPQRRCSPRCSSPPRAA